ncbi:hypothetical protein Hanom_Chr09g00773831 [Helianthus anomalus]
MARGGRRGQNERYDLTALRLKKTEEQYNIKDRQYEHDQRWVPVISKKQVRQEKKFLNREMRLRNTTSFYISNLHDSCNRDRLWKAFCHLDWKMFLARRKEMGLLKEVRIDGAVLDVNLAKFNRDGSKVIRPNTEERVSVFSRLKRVEPVNQVEQQVYRGPDFANEKVTNPKVGRSYSSVEFKSLVGEAKDIDILNNLNNLLEIGLELSYLGGLKVLISFLNNKEADDFLRLKVETWEQSFSRHSVWEGVPPLFNRVAWIKVLGVPVSLWDRHIIKKIEERCGRLLVKSEASAEDGNLAEDRLAVLVKSRKRISEEFSLTWKDQTIKVWVEEISGQWCPPFLNKESSEDVEVLSESYEEMSEMGSPAKSLEVGKFSKKVEEEPNGCMLGSSPTGNYQNVC